MAEAKKPGPKAVAQPQAAEPQAAADSTPKKKKVNEMTLAEIGAKLDEIRVSQGGLTSRYAQQLLARKKSLSS